MSAIDPTVEGDVNADRLSENASTPRRPSDSAILRRDDAAFVHQGLSTPCLDEVVGASGSALVLRGGRRVLDFHGNGVHNVGFGHPAVIEAVTRQLSTLPFCTRRYTHEAAVKAAERVGRATGGALGRVLFAPAGTLAVSTAIRLARIATGKTRILTMDGSFHGASLDVAAVAGQAAFRVGVDPATPEPLCVSPPPHDAGRGEIDVAAQATLRGIEEHLAAGHVAAVLSEPIRWTTVEVPAPGFWSAVREICDRYGALLIFDEIGAGLGRTGRMYAFEHFRVMPDMLCLGKSLGGGVVPTAAVAVREAMNVAGSQSPGHYTHEKSPAGCAAASAVFDILEGEGLVDNAASLGRIALDRLESWARSRTYVAGVRGVGLLLAIELRDVGVTSARALALDAMQRALEGGVNFKVTAGRVITLTPALIIGRDELLNALTVVCDAVDEAASRGSVAT